MNIIIKQKLKKNKYLLILIKKYILLKFYKLKVIKYLNNFK